MGKQIREEQIQYDTVWQTFTESNHIVANVSAQRMQRDRDDIKEAVKRDDEEWGSDTLTEGEG
jgi:DNA phosphorothioation-dependent restriction protein DptG